MMKRRPLLPILFLLCLHYYLYFTGYAAVVTGADVSRGSFPEGFVFGTATSAYQVEGMAHKEGRGPSIWDKFIKTPGLEPNNATGEVSVDQYHRYKKHRMTRNMEQEKRIFDGRKIMPEEKKKSPKQKKKSPEERRKLQTEITRERSRESSVYFQRQSKMTKT